MRPNLDGEAGGHGEDEREGEDEDEHRDSLGSRTGLERDSSRLRRGGPTSRRYNRQVARRVLLG
jgi:hypothetical protein